MLVRNLLVRQRQTIDALQKQLDALQANRPAVTNAAPPATVTAPAGTAPASDPSFGDAFVVPLFAADRYRVSSWLETERHDDKRTERVQPAVGVTRSMTEVGGCFAGGVAFG